ncbi:unnamed protein product [Larinioides sclopetarius]|uniref:Uncharacterized protein n=1 Tax=Larinioides sclopetarius TaxID=280406 RepID=A0AAV2A5D8_9ARAC
MHTVANSCFSKSPTRSAGFRVSLEEVSKEPG